MICFMVKISSLPLERAVSRPVLSRALISGNEDFKRTGGITLHAFAARPLMGTDSRTRCI